MSATIDVLMALFRCRLRVEEGGMVVKWREYEEAVVDVFSIDLNENEWSKRKSVGRVSEEGVLGVVGFFWGVLSWLSQLGMK